MSSYFKQKLNEGEEPLLLLRQHGGTFVWPVTRTILLAMIPVVFINYVFQYNWLTYIAFGWWVFVAIWGLISWFTWYFNITLVTSQRVVDISQKGPFSRQVREVSYDKISEVTFEIKGLIATIFGYGNVLITFAGGGKPIVIKAVASPEIIKDQILKVREFTSKGGESASGMSAQELTKFIQKTKESASSTDEGKKVTVRINHYKDGE